MLVNLGCGPIQPSGWVNVDYSNRARFAHSFPTLHSLLVALKIMPPTEFSNNTVIFDVREPLPFEDAAVTAFYAGELWEHLLVNEAESLARECFRCLRPGGHLRVNVPDNYKFWKKYNDSHEEMVKKPRNLWSDDYSKERVGTFFEYICTSKTKLFRSMGHYHKWAYDEVSLILQFERSGFIGVNVKKPYDSAIPSIKDVETAPMLIVEGAKPST